MGQRRDAYGNSRSTGYTIDFFRHNAIGAAQAFLASPFFNTYDPIHELSKHGCLVKLIVRLCPITPPCVLRQALTDSNVLVRYYTDRAFHAKLYIIDNIALVGSANLTNSGLMSNREVSVVLVKDRDGAFDDVRGMFNLFWEYADVLTPDVCSRYEEAYRKIGVSTAEEELQAHVERFVHASKPPSAAVGSDRVSKRRAFLQGLRRKYDEELIPAFNEVRRVFEASGLKRPEFAQGDSEIELGRYLGWLRIVHAPGDSWRETRLADAAEREQRIMSGLEHWAAVEEATAGDMVRAENEVGNIHRLRAAFASPARLEALSYDELFDALSGVHAFYDRLRFVAGGLEGLRADFVSRNPVRSIKDSLHYLLYGDATALERAYDCIYDERRKLGGFGEACVMELLGWMDRDRPPINGRTIKALRFLGFDVHD
jgi:hypothetical protein